jgi:4-hydroxybenzoate polyprenyltransferase
LVVFAAPLFAFNLGISSLLNSSLAFILFCFTSSSFYLLNDVADIESDRRHPVKCKRPIAAGLISVPFAVVMAGALLSSALFIGWRQSLGLGAAITSYALVQIAYNLKLKRTVILDIVAIAAGFVLRAYGGAAATGIHLSAWFILCTAMLALFLGVEKRKAELRLLAIRGGTTRSVLKRYSLPLLSRMENVVTTGTVVAYSLWSSGPHANGASTAWMLLTLPFVLYGIFRYQLLSDPEEIARRSDIGLEQGGQSERPEEVLLKDLPILITVLGWVLTALAILLLQHQGLIK